MKRILSSILFCALTMSLLLWTNHVAVSKSTNRYYILDRELAERDEEYDVQIYGSCHAYTSFNPVVFTAAHNISAYNMANPSEIIPTTYLRMLERFQQDAPEVALVELWGVQAYETYLATEDILGNYMSVNIERLPLSREKLEVIQDFDTLSLLNENFAIAKYKDRFLELELESVDFQYSFEATEPYSNNYIFSEMTSRLANNGFKSNPPVPVPEYGSLQSSVSPDDTLEVEPVLVKYLDKIIDLCEEYDVELIFYRAPYVSTENELRKVNWIRSYCEEKDVLFLDLEAELDYDYNLDFYDNEHLSVVGASKSTTFLADHILAAMEG